MSSSSHDLTDPESNDGHQDQFEPAINVGCLSHPFRPKGSFEYIEHGVDPDPSLRLHDQETLEGFPGIFYCVLKYIFNDKSNPYNDQNSFQDAENH